MQGEQCTSLLRRYLIAALPIELSGTTELDITVSFDCNFRSALWEWQTARDCITQYLPYVDVLEWTYLTCLPIALKL